MNMSERGSRLISSTDFPLCATPRYIYMHSYVCIHARIS